MRSDKSDNFLNPLEAGFERVISPFQEFTRNQTTASLLLLLCTVVALIIANSSYSHSYETLLKTPVGFAAGEFALKLSIHGWINEGLMAVFFFILGLEIKREILVGELKEPKQSIPVIIAAFGGMILPATIFLAFNADTPASHGWGIPMATDTAFAVGILALFKNRIPIALLTFLTALAIIDDIGAILVIALFYTKTLNLVSISVAGLLLLVLIVFNLIGVRRAALYFAGAFFIWMALLNSGVHATIAGILVAFIVPARPKREPEWFINRVKKLVSRFEHIENTSAQPILGEESQHLVVEQVQDSAEKASTPLRRWERRLEQPVGLFVMPIFALANAGIPIDIESISSLWDHSLSLGIIFALVFGKSLGITLFCWIAVRIGLGNLPRNVTMHHIFGLGLVGGIGFTMAIFIAGLGFNSDPQAILLAKSAIIIGSLVAGLSGAMWLRIKG